MENTDKFINLPSRVATYSSDRGKTLLIDSDPNRTSIKWSKRGNLPFVVEQAEVGCRIKIERNYFDGDNNRLS
jgi:hypothetical protein